MIWLSATKIDPENRSYRHGNTRKNTKKVNADRWSLSRWVIPMPISFLCYFVDLPTKQRHSSVLSVFFCVLPWPIKVFSLMEVRPRRGGKVRRARQQKAAPGGGCGNVA
ncbi:hypothetical protein [Vogesella fluminis]|uniref:hypothetical protein n=1 Tax=Vogesella fluminis TaxID=1069161 RepID=UPI00167ABC61|nr:hypothetical protein [Vogesella fluminis]